MSNFRNRLLAVVAFVTALLVFPTVPTQNTSAVAAMDKAEQAGMWKQAVENLLMLPLPVAPDIKDCTSQETTEIAQAIDWGANHWKEYEAVIEAAADINVKNCLEERFKKNGKVVCEKSMKGQCKGANGWASPFNKKCHMCPDFLSTVRRLDGAANRKACYFALITHEWAHTCERTHKSVEIIDNTAFTFWKDKHPDVTITFSQCGMD